MAFGIEVKSVKKNIFSGAACEMLKGLVTEAATMNPVVLIHKSASSISGKQFNTFHRMNCLGDSI